MLYSAAYHRAGVLLRRQTSKRSHIASTDIARPGSAAQIRLDSALISNRPSTANFRRTRPSTSHKTTDVDRIKALETLFLLTEKEVNDFYRAFCHMAKRKVQSSYSYQRKTKPSRPWEDKKSCVTLTLKAFFSTFDLPSENGGFYDHIFELVGINNFHSMTFW
jgi:hypothetical protein